MSCDIHQNKDYWEIRHLMRCYPATELQIKGILHTLESSREKTDSSDFLNGFPWEHTNWYSCQLEYSNVESLFLFWDGTAWGESLDKPPRRLDEGASCFIRITSDPIQSNNTHLKRIKYWLKKYEAGEILNSEHFLILAGLNENSPLLILDGNHRLSAAMWWAIKKRDLSELPRMAWIGFSNEMKNYMFYARIT